MSPSMVFHGYGSTDIILHLKLYARYHSTNINLHFNLSTIVQQHDISTTKSLSSNIPE